MRIGLFDWLRPQSYLDFSIGCPFEKGVKHRFCGIIGPSGASLASDVYHFLQFVGPPSLPSLSLERVPCWLAERTTTLRSACVRSSDRRTITYVDLPLYFDPHGMWPKLSLIHI